MAEEPRRRGSPSRWSSRRARSAAPPCWAPVHVNCVVAPRALAASHFSRWPSGVNVADARARAVITRFTEIGERGAVAVERLRMNPQQLERDFIAVAPRTRRATGILPIKLELQRSTGAIFKARAARSSGRKGTLIFLAVSRIGRYTSRFMCMASSCSPTRWAYTTTASGTCDAATEADAQRQCDALQLLRRARRGARGGGRRRLGAPHDALHAFRTKLEEHLCYWRPPPRPKQKAPGRPRGVGSHGRTTLPERNRLKAQQPGARSGRWTEEEHAEFLRLHAIHWTLSPRRCRSGRSRRSGATRRSTTCESTRGRPRRRRRARRRRSA